MTRVERNPANGTLRAKVKGWRPLVPIRARLEMPPLPGAPVYGLAARAEVRRIWAWAKRRPRVRIGWNTDRKLRLVVKGRFPLYWSDWQGVVEYVTNAKAIKSRPAPEPRRMVLHIAPGRGPMILR